MSILPLQQEKTIQHDWETWLKEKKAILVGRSIHGTSISIQTDFNSVVVETFANLVKDNDVDAGEDIGKGSNSDESVKKGVSGSGDVAESVDRSENCAALSEENHGASLNMGNKANHAFAVEHNVDNMKIDKIRDEFEEKDVQNDESIVCDILEESMKVSPAEKAITDIFFQTFSKSSVMDLRPNSEFSLSLDSELQEKVLHEVFDSIDQLITDELHEYLTNFFNADRGPQRVGGSCRRFSHQRGRFRDRKKFQKIAEGYTDKIAFSLAGISPLRDVSTLEGVHLNQFVHPVIDSVLWIFAKINYIYGEIPFKGLKIRADGVGLLNDVVNYPLVCGEGARPAASQKKKIDDDIKNAKTMTSLYKQIVLSEADARKQLFLDLRIYGWTAFKVDVSLTMLDFRGTYRLFEVDRFDLPKDLGRHAKFRFYVRGCDQVGAMR
ncbi:hypothetical protein BC936DRAFT_140396 [Jimgerdemannia flammicorona]|uniref:Uncharacterized protein n=1 Tax=Jimgerdemannia flammicorona TaxID=994334 RepID=A0A433AUD1_9FUNG|nr:hypothetical protein BC936DRAFT_140396 [Jimgerdemannia flammicorona]